MRLKYWRAALETMRGQLDYVRDENRALHGSLGEARRQLRETQAKLLLALEDTEALAIQLADAQLLLAAAQRPALSAAA